MWSSVLLVAMVLVPAGELLPVFRIVEPAISDVVLHRGESLLEAALRLAPGYGAIRMYDVHSRPRHMAGSSWGVSVVKIVAGRDREVLDVELEAETGPAARKPEGFSVLQESESAISALEAKVNALERRRLKDR